MLDHENQAYRDEYDKLKDQYVDAWSKATILEESKKPFLAYLETQAIEHHEGEKELTVAGAQRLAMINPLYKEHIKRMVEAKRESKRLELALKALECKWMKS